MIKLCYIFATLIMLIVSGCGAQAQTARAWVSGHGIDQAGCGSLATPCRTIQYPLTNRVAAGGEIDILDAGSFGPFIIFNGISIVNGGGGDAIVTAQQSGDAIQIDASPYDAVNLQGLTIEGGGVALNGVSVQNGASVTMTNCVVRGFQNDGVLLNPISQSTNFNFFVTIANTLVSQNKVGIEIKSSTGFEVQRFVFKKLTAVDNSADGILVDPNGTTSEISISDSNLSNNYYGLLLQPTSGTYAFAEINRTTASNNFTGFYLSASKASATIRDSVASDNTNAGFAVAIAGASLTLGHSSASGNGVGLFVGSGATAATFGNNEFSNNSADFSGGFNSSITLH